MRLPSSKYTRICFFFGVPFAKLVALWARVLFGLAQGESLGVEVLESVSVPSKTKQYSIAMCEHARFVPSLFLSPSNSRRASPPGACYDKLGKMVRTFGLSGYQQATGELIVGQVKTAKDQGPSLSRSSQLREGSSKSGEHVAQGSEQLEPDLALWPLNALRTTPAYHPNTRTRGSRMRRGPHPRTFAGIEPLSKHQRTKQTF